MARTHTKRELKLTGLSYTVHEYNKINVEDVLVHKSKEVLFHLKTRKRWASSLVSANIRRALVRSDLNG